MSDMLSIGASGVRAYQSALTTVSENIANAGTAGYTRRTAALKEVVAVSGSTDGAVTGLGVVAGGITRAGNDARAADVRTASSDLAKSETGAAWLQRIENALTGGRLGDQLTGFFTSATAVAADPSSVAPRAAMLEAATGVATSFATTGDALDAAAAELDASADAAVSTLNGLLAGLAKINSGLGRTQPGTSGSAALLDQRDKVLEQLSTIADVAVSLDAAGRATVRGGSGGPLLVQGDTATIVTYVRNEEGGTSFAVHGNGETMALNPGGGALAGMAEGAQRIAAARTQLNELAAAFTSGVNAFQANGRDLTGATGQPMFATGDSPTDIEVVLSDPRGIAAAAVGGGVRDNRNLAVLASLRTTGGFETRMTDLVSTNAAALSSRESVSEAQSAIRDQAVAARDSASGVNIDEEAVNLMRFQQAYQASSRVIQIARETLQSILDIR